MEEKERVALLFCQAKGELSRLAPQKLCPPSLNRERLDLSQTGSVQFSSVAQSCLTLCDPMNHSTPGLPVHHQLPEFTQTHVH